MKLKDSKNWEFQKILRFSMMSFVQTMWVITGPPDGETICRPIQSKMVRKDINKLNEFGLNFIQNRNSH